MKDLSGICEMLTSCRWWYLACSWILTMLNPAKTCECLLLKFLHVDKANKREERNPQHVFVCDSA